MHLRGHHWTRAAATAVLCLLTATAVVLHQQQSGGADALTPGAATDPHIGHIMPEAEAVPVAVTTGAPLPRSGWTAIDATAQSPADNVLDNDPDTSWKSAAGLPRTIT